MKASTLLQVAKTALKADATQAQRQDAMDAITKYLEDPNTDKTPWWVILLKVLAYAIGLLLAGYGTVAASVSLFGLM